MSCVDRFKFSGATDNCVGSMASSPAARFTQLDLIAGEITDAGAIFLSEWPCGAGLKRLNLCANRIGDGGAAALAESQYLAGLTELNLERNPIGRDGRRRLVARFGGNVILPPEA